MADAPRRRQTPDGRWQYLASDCYWYYEPEMPGVQPTWPTGFNLGTNGLAITSLVLGILWLGWLGSLLAIIFAFVALREIREEPQEGRGLAIAGMILGWIGMASLLLVIILAVVLDPRSTTISVTGDTSAKTTITVDVSGQEQQKHTVVLPYAQTFTGYPRVIKVRAQTQDGSSSARISCAISPSGDAPIINTSTGPYALVTCAGTRT